MKPGHIALLVVILGWTLWYVFDALGVSSNMRNIILIVPTAVIVTLAATWELLRQVAMGLSWIATPVEVPSDLPGAEVPQMRADVVRGVILLGMLGVLVFSLAHVGFDLAVFVFLVASLILLDRDRMLAKVAFAAIFTVIVVGGARMLLPFPMHTILL